MDPGAFEAVVASVNEWRRTGAAIPTLSVRRGPTVEVGYERDGPNQNTIRYFPEGHPLALGALAVTISTVKIPSGELLDADIILNGVYRFGDAARTSSDVFDIQNTLTHEIGHALGLDEDLEHEGATMFVSSKLREQKKRTLAEVDRLAIIERYGVAGWFDFTPLDTVEYQCSVAPGATGPAWLLGVFALGAAGLAARRRKCRRGWIAVAVLAGGAVASLPASASQPTHFGDSMRIHHADPVASDWSDLTVVGASARWEGSLLVTDLDVEPTVGTEDLENPERISVLGGAEGNLAQVVAGLPVPGIGERVSVPVDVSTDTPVLAHSIRFRASTEGSQETADERH